VLLLDEPSNDLDVETLRALEDALLEFAGCVLVISHDRWFLDRICTHILACEGDSQWTFFAGNYQEYEEDKKKRLGEEGAKPKRIRYKPINARRDHPGGRRRGYRLRHDRYPHDLEGFRPAGQPAPPA
jgi:sulfate-transporting ATPase